MGIPTALEGTSTEFKWVIFNQLKSIENCYLLDVDGLQIEVQRKPVKHFNLRVYPPEGRVKISVPLMASEQKIRQILIKKIAWIKHKQAIYQKHLTESISRETPSNDVYLFGEKLSLIVNERIGQPDVEQISTELHVNLKPNSPVLNLNKILGHWHRQQLKESIPALFEKWEPIIGVSAKEWRIKKMKTRWGSCNIFAKRVWLNLELVKKPRACLEYVVVHELTHLHERYHNARFKALLDSYLPNWRETERLLNPTR